ncbi:hypothetical protein D0Z06_14220 [Geodermatophilus marinus]|nr:hypothetical protein D0Z06_14220 [Geodermatophilus sp. LHW52908]
MSTWTSSRTRRSGTARRSTALTAAARKRESRPGWAGTASRASDEPAGTAAQPVRAVRTVDHSRWSSSSSSSRETHAVAPGPRPTQSASSRVLP